MTKTNADKKWAKARKFSRPVKRCDNCEHAMASELSNQVYCIRYPAVPLFVNGNMISSFPMMMRHGKCDEFKQGEVQKQNEPLR